MNINYLKHHVYPGQALVSAWIILQEYATLDDALRKTEYGFSEAESNCNIPGAGGSYLRTRVSSSL